MVTEFGNNLFVKVGARFSGAVSAIEDVVSVDELGELISGRIGAVVPHDGYMLFGLDPVTGVGCFHTRRHGYREGAARRFMNAYLVDGSGGVPCPFLSALGSRVVVLSAGSPENQRSARLREVVTEGFGSEMRIGLTWGGVVWGGLVLTRALGSRPFSRTEAAHAERLVAPLGATVRQFVTGRGLRPTNHARPPGVVIVDAEDTITMSTKAGLAWLRELVPDCAFGDPTRLGGALWTIAEQARLDPSRALTRVPTRDGWVNVHAQPLDGAAGREVVVTLQPATAVTLLPAVAAWYGLTPRETMVAALALEGLAGKQIARKLDVSLYTVNDHFKAIYRKTGVTGRDEFVAGLLA